MMNKDQCGYECPRCSEDETWEHVVKCKMTILIRRRLVKNLLKELTLKRPSNVDQEEILSFIEDMLRYLDDDNSDEFETNQGMIGF